MKNHKQRTVMNQVIEGKTVHVVDFDTMPELPIHGLTNEESFYQRALSMARGFINPAFDPKFPTTGKYARALNDAIEKGIITKPGKYAIHIPAGSTSYEIYSVVE